MDELIPGQLYSIALAAPLLELNDLTPETAYTWEPTDENVKRCKHMLMSGWSIEDTATLKERLEWLLKEGHSSSFMEIRSFLSTLSEAGQAAYIEALPKNTTQHIEYEIVRAYNNRIPYAGIAAWDFGRYSYLCQAGMLVGYLSEGEGWDLMKKVAILAQKCYSSWVDYGLAYFIGRLFWLEELNSDHTNRHYTMIQSLLINPHSLWRRLDWNLVLE